MKEHIIRAILRQDMSVKWKDAELNGNVNVHLNVHQKTRQFVEAELDEFVLSDDEAILASFEKSIDGEYYHENPTKMERVDGESRVFRLQIPTIVHNTPGEWGIQFLLVTDYDPSTSSYTYAYPFDLVKFSEYSSFFDDGLNIPSSDNFRDLYQTATKAINDASSAVLYAEKSQEQADRAEEIANNLDGTTTPSGGAYVKYDDFGGVNVSDATLQSSHAAPVSWVQGQMESLKKLLDEQIGKKFDKEGGTVGGSVTVTGDLTVQGTTRTNDTETLSVKDNVIVTNAEGAELADNSGLVIRTGATTAYAVAYNPATDGVTIGEGTLSEDGEFTYTAGEAQYLATIDWGMTNGNLPKFNQTTKRLEDSGIPADDVLTKTAAPKFWRLI